MNEFLLLITLVLVRPVTDGGPERVGDVLSSHLIGAAETLDECNEGGRIIADQLYAVGGGAVLALYGCFPIPSDTINAIAKAQKWERGL